MAPAHSRLVEGPIPGMYFRVAVQEAIQPMEDTPMMDSDTHLTETEPVIDTPMMDSDTHLTEAKSIVDTPMMDSDTHLAENVSVGELPTPGSMPEASSHALPEDYNPPSSNLLCTLPMEMVLEIASYLDCGEQNSLLKTCRDLHTLLHPGLKKQPDKYGNDRYLFWLLKTGNLAELAARSSRPGPLSSTLFTFEGDLLASYTSTARAAVRDRMGELSSTSPQYPCLRVDKSGLMVAIDHQQWEVVVFLLRRDSGRVGFLGSREHFWETDETPAERPVAPICVAHPPMWEAFCQPEDQWRGSLFLEGDPRFLARLLTLARSQMPSQRQETTRSEMDGSVVVLEE
ncbi:hypothetical protein PG993_005801 [Apiospora rasikravindrae]|uniref:F-box domain-containing protein n=1 Tax=Apiospora rasikravindrae TaxID=990691 RepID=A0ABR1TBK3_9PEZI